MLRSFHELRDRIAKAREHLGQRVLVLEEVRREQTGQPNTDLGLSLASPALCTSTSQRPCYVGRPAGDGTSLRREGPEEAKRGFRERRRDLGAHRARLLWDRVGLKVLMVGLTVLPLPVVPRCEASPIRGHCASVTRFIVVVGARGGISKPPQYGLPCRGRVEYRRRSMWKYECCR